MENYICSITLAKECRSLFVQGVANERAGRYTFDILQDPKNASLYFKNALLVYEEWTAQRKVDHLRAELKVLYGNDEYENIFKCM